MPYQSPLFTPIRRRNPFSAGHLPFLARLYRTAYKTRRRFSKRFIGKPSKKLFRFLYDVIGMGGEGTFVLDRAGTPVTVPFNARNSQYSALYLPQNADGYETETAALLDVLAGDDARFLDVGANWGFYSLYLAARLSFRGRIDAIEPWPPTYADLARAVKSAGLDGVITCHNVALSAEGGSAAMGLPDGLQSGLARLSAGGNGGTEVTLAPLDALDLPAPDVIKIDVEGHETEAIRGAQRTLGEHKPHVIFESWLEPHNPEVTMAPFRALADLGYVFYQPAWSRADVGGRYAVDGKAGDDSVLALIPLSPEQRFLLADQINALAVHESRLDDVAALFAGAEA